MTDGNIENLATTLPHLKNLRLGQPCHHSSYNTAVTSLGSISIHCLDLTVLKTHLNVRDVVGDMECLMEEGAGRDTAKYKLGSLSVGVFPFGVCEEIETVAAVFKVIFHTSYQ